MGRGNRHFSNTADTMSKIGKVSTDGMSDIAFVRSQNEYGTEDFRKRQLGSFGIITNDGEIRCSWIETSGHPKYGKRSEKPIPLSHWAKYQLESMFRGWHEEPTPESFIEPVTPISTLQEDLLCEDIQVVI